MSEPRSVAIFPPNIATDVFNAIEGVTYNKTAAEIVSDNPGTFTIDQDDEQNDCLCKHGVTAEGNITATINGEGEPLESCDFVEGRPPIKP